MNATLISETARNVMKKMKIDPELLRKCPQKSLDFQGSIIKYQSKREERIKPEFAVMDRCAIDPLVYAKTSCEQWEKLLDMPETHRCMERYKSGEYIIFLIEPQMACLKDDGIRMMSNGFDEWKDFSDSFKDLMDQHKISFHVIEELDMEARFTKVFRTLFKL